MKRIGLFGGSFDPPHHAHLALARLARDTLRLDELRLVPAGEPWQKAGRLRASAAHRAAMVGLAIEREPRLHLETCELRRPGPTYTVDTVEQLQALQPAAQWFLVIGQDQYAQLHTWHRWRELLQRVTLAVAGRDNAAPQAGAEVAAVPHRLVTLPLPPMPHTSTELRARLRAGADVSVMVPPAVARYIARNHLYRS